MSSFTGTIKNKRAYFDYEILEKIDAGIKLLGHEVKSIKEGKGNLTGSFVKFKDNEAWLVGLEIPLFSKAGSLQSHETNRTRKLLLKRKEIDRLKKKVEEKTYTVAPLKIYIQKGLIKIQIGLAKGKKFSEKRAEMIKKQQNRETERLIKESNS